MATSLPPCPSKTPKRALSVESIYLTFATWESSYNRKIFWYKVNGDEERDFGSKQYKKIHDKNFDKNWGDNQDKLTMGNIMPGKRGAKKFNIRLVDK